MIFWLLFLVIFFYFFVLILSLKPKLCINCKYFLTDNKLDKFGTCLLFPRIDNQNYLLVNGIDDVKLADYHYCVTARGSISMCGQDGKEYKRRYKRIER